MKTSLCSLQPMAEIHCKILEIIEHLMNPKPHKIKAFRLGFLLPFKTVRSSVKWARFGLCNTTDFLTLMCTNFFNPYLRLKRRDLPNLWPKTFGLCMHKENRLTLVPKTRIFFFSLPPKLPRPKPSQEHSKLQFFSLVFTPLNTRWSKKILGSNKRIFHGVCTP